MTFIDDTSLQELKAKVWEEGYEASIFANPKNPYKVNNLENYPDTVPADYNYVSPHETTQQLYERATNYCAEGAHNED